MPRILFNFVLSQIEKLDELKVKFRKTGLKYRTLKLRGEYQIKNREIINNAFNVCSQNCDSVYLQALVERYERNKETFLEKIEELSHLNYSVDINCTNKSIQTNLIENSKMTTRGGDDIGIDEEGHVEVEVVGGRGKDKFSGIIKKLNFHTHRKTQNISDSEDERNEKDKRRKVTNKSKSHRKAHIDSDSESSDAENSESHSEEEEVKPRKNFMRGVHFISMVDRVAEFSGEGKNVSDNLDTFLCRVKSFMHDVPKRQTPEFLIHLRSRLRGQAKRVFDKNDIDSYKSLAKIFRTEFIPFKNVSKKLMEICSMKRAQGESVLRFGSRMSEEFSFYRKDIRKTFGDDIDQYDWINEMIMTAFKREIKGSKLAMIITIREITDLDEALKIARKVQEEDDEATSYDSPSIARTYRQNNFNNDKNYRLNQSRHNGYRGNQDARGNSNNYAAQNRFEPPGSFAPKQNLFNNNRNTSYNPNQGRRINYTSRSNTNSNLQQSNYGNHQYSKTNDPIKSSHVHFNKDMAREETNCSYCGGRGHSILRCSTLEAEMGKAREQS